MSTDRDVFLCHASEDKSTVLRPLVSALEAARITYWYDEAEIQWGDSISEKVNAGLRMSRYVLVVFSQAFVEKNWPQRELNAVLNIEASTGEVRVLPLLIGSSEQRRRILEAYPIVNDKAFVAWDSGISSVVEALQARLDEKASNSSRSTEASSSHSTGMVIPEIKRRVSQRDKDRFLRETFSIIRAYFEVGGRELTAKYQEVEADLEDIQKYKFVFSVYRNGDIVTRCKIWLGGPVSSDSISFAQGNHIDINNDNSMNDWLSIVDKGSELGLRASGMGFGFSAAQDFYGKLSSQRAAEYLWLRAIDMLRHV
jgi:hypothetical protein